MRSFRILLFCLYYFITFLGTAQENNVTNGSGEIPELNFDDTDKGVVLPKVRLENLKPSPSATSKAIPEGLLVYNTNKEIGNGFYFWDGEEWLSILKNSKDKNSRNYHTSLSICDFLDCADMSKYDETGVSDFIDEAIKSIGTLGTIYFPSGNYLITRPIILKNQVRLLGENARGTIISILDENYEGDTMIQNDTGSFYNYIENFNLKNDFDLENLVMVHFVHLWEGSYIKNINLWNSGTVKGGIWHSMQGKVQGGGGQLIVENINVFNDHYLNPKGICLEENVKLKNNGGLYCKNWNINNFRFPDKPTRAVVRLETHSLVLDASNIHIERSPGNGQPSLKIVGHHLNTLRLRDSDIIPDDNLGTKIGIEINLANNYGTVNWDIENVSLRSTSFENSSFDIPIRLKHTAGIIEDVIGDVKLIKKFTNSIRDFEYYSNSLGIGEGVISQQYIGELKKSKGAIIKTPHMIHNIPLNNTLYTSSSDAKGYLVIVSGVNTSKGDAPIGGLFHVIYSENDSNKGAAVISRISGDNELDLEYDNANLILKNDSSKNLDKLNVMIIGTGSK